ANADGSNQRNLTQNAAADRQPAWSPDGSRIAFVSDRDGRQDLYVMNADGSNPTRLTDGCCLSVDAEPTWSPDGKQIAFGSTGPFNGGWHIWGVNADGTNLRQLTQGPGVDPAWSPDGSTVAYSSGSDYIYFVGADGTGEHVFNIPMQGVGPEVAPAWSPDGTMIAFAAYAPPQVGNEAALFIAGVNGTSVQQITDWGP